MRDTTFPGVPSSCLRESKVVLTGAHDFVRQSHCDPRHDYHHSHNVGNFGSFFVFWDWLCGTDQAYLAWRSRKDAKVAHVGGAQADKPEPADS